jgi:hypothetical protein
MKRQQHRTTEDIFAQMHQQLRTYDPEIPQSPKRLDPLLQMLLRLYADQLSQIDSRLDQTWQEATRELIKAVAPEGRRWPLPAYTVMRCIPNDPVVEVDRHVRFFYKEKREGGQTLFFSPLREHRILAAETRVLLLRQGDRLINMSPPAEGEEGPVTSEFTTLDVEQPVTLWAAFEYQGPPSKLAGSRVFVKAEHEAAEQIWWGRWIFGDRDGEFANANSFVPGAHDDQVDSKPLSEWGGLRTDEDVFASLNHHFVRLPENRTQDWKAGPPDPDLESLMPGPVREVADSGDLYWLKVELSERGDRSRLRTGIALYFDCVPVINKFELNLFKHTGGARVIEIEIPENLDKILEVTSVEDSADRHYIPAHEIVSDPEVRRYTPQRRGDKLALWFDFSEEPLAPPDSLNITYAVTTGPAANAIEQGRINQLYESHPGLSEVSNVLPTEGGAPARTDEQLVTEAALRLRSRDRALSFDEIRNWVSTYDPRIERVECAKGVQQGEYGVRRCIVVRARVDGERFHSDVEVELLRARLERFLKSRAPVNTQFTVEVTDQ